MTIATLEAPFVPHERITSSWVSWNQNPNMFGQLFILWNHEKGIIQNFQFYGPQGFHLELADWGFRN